MESKLSYRKNIYDQTGINRLIETEKDIDRDKHRYKQIEMYR